jgi:citrate synthase
MIDVNGVTYLEGSEAAELLGVKPETLYAYVSRGRLKSFRQGVGRRRLYLKSDILSLLRLEPSGAEGARSSPVFSPRPPQAPSDGLESHQRFPPAGDWASER